MVRFAMFMCLVAAAVAGCGSDRATRGEGTIEVVTTLPPLADIVRNAGGERVEVVTLVRRGADPHRWRPFDSAFGRLREADLVVLAGGAIDEWAQGSGAERELVLLPRLDPLGDDPHWWQDPVRVQEAAKEIRNELARADIDGAGYYEAATADFLERLRTLHADMKICFGHLDRLPARLATPHAGFAYLVERYGLPIAGPRGRGAEVGRRLWADTLAEPGRPAGSYLGAMTENTEMIMEALSGGTETCRPQP